MDRVYSMGEVREIFPDKKYEYAFRLPGIPLGLFYLESILKRNRHEKFDVDIIQGEEIKAHIIVREPLDDDVFKELKEKRHC